MPFRLRPCNMATGTDTAPNTNDANQEVRLVGGGAVPVSMSMRTEEPRTRVVLVASRGIAPLRLVRSSSLSIDGSQFLCAAVELRLCGGEGAEAHQIRLRHSNMFDGAFSPTTKDRKIRASHLISILTPVWNRSGCRLFITDHQ
jgi:hypothetical protein